MSPRQRGDGTIKDEGVDSINPGGGSPPPTTAQLLEAQYHKLNDMIHAEKISNCGALVQFIASAVGLLGGDSTALSEVSKMFSVRKDGGRGFTFTGGTAPSGGWNTIYRDSLENRNQATHAILFFVFGANIGASPVGNMGVLLAAAYAREVHDAWRNYNPTRTSTIAEQLTFALTNINRGDYNLSIGAGLAAGSLTSNDPEKIKTQLREEFCNK